MLVKRVNIEEQQLDLDKEYLALNSDGKIVHELTPDDLLQELKKSDEMLYVCIVTDTK